MRCLKGLNLSIDFPRSHRSRCQKPLKHRTIYEAGSSSHSQRKEWGGMNYFLNKKI